MDADKLANRLAAEALLCDDMYCIPSKQAGRHTVECSAARVPVVASALRPLVEENELLKERLRLITEKTPHWKTEEGPEMTLEQALFRVNTWLKVSNPWPGKRAVRVIVEALDAAQSGREDG